MPASWELQVCGTWVPLNGTVVPRKHEHLTQAQRALMPGSAFTWRCAAGLMWLERIPGIGMVSASVALLVNLSQVRCETVYRSAEETPAWTP